MELDPTLLQNKSLSIYSHKKEKYIRVSFSQHKGNLQDLPKHFLKYFALDSGTNYMF